MSPLHICILSGLLIAGLDFCAGCNRDHSSDRSGHIFGRDSIHDAIC